MRTSPWYSVKNGIGLPLRHAPGPVVLPQSRWLRRFTKSGSTSSTHGMKPKKEPDHPDFDQWLLDYIEKESE